MDDQTIIDSEERRFGDYFSHFRDAMDNISTASYPRALLSLSEAIELHPCNDLAHYYQGYCYYKLEQHEMAIESFSNCLKHSFYHENCHEWIGDMFCILNQFQQGFEYYMKQLQLISSHSPSITNSSSSSSTSPSPSPSPSSSFASYPLDFLYCKIGRTLEDMTRYEEALQYYDQALLLNPQNDVVYRFKSNTLNYMNRFDESLLAINKCLELDPLSSSAYNIKGNCLRKIERYEEALNCYEEALRLDPSPPLYWNRKGELLLQLNRPNEAIASFKKSLKVNQKLKCGFDQWNKGMSLAYLNQHEEALEWFDRAISSLPTYFFIYVSKGCSLYSLERYEESIRVLDMAIMVNPRDYSGYLKKGRSLLMLQRYEEASWCFDKTIQLNPKNTEARRYQTNCSSERRLDLDSSAVLF